MARMTINLDNCFEGNAYPLEKIQPLASRISIAAYEAGLDVKTTVADGKSRTNM